MDLSSKRYIKRSFCEIRFDQRPERLCLSGSGFPSPAEGSSDRSISLSNLHKVLCSRLSFSRIASYASQVLPSNTSDLIDLLGGRLVALSTGMSSKGIGNLLHEVFALEHMKGFLLPLPVIGAHNHKGLACPPGYLERLVPTNHLFYKTFQVVSKFVYADRVHRITFMYGNAVQIYSDALTKPSSAPPFFVAPPAPLQLMRPLINST